MAMSVEPADKYRELAREGHIPSGSAAVREAMEAAARDPLFIKIWSR